MFIGNIPSKLLFSEKYGAMYITKIKLIFY